MKKFYDREREMKMLENLPKKRRNWWTGTAETGKRGFCWSQGPASLKSASKEWMRKG